MSEYFLPNYESSLRKKLQKKKYFNKDRNKTNS